MDDDRQTGAIVNQPFATCRPRPWRELAGERTVPTASVLAQVVEESPAFSSTARTDSRLSTIAVRVAPGFAHLHRESRSAVMST